MSLYIDLLSVLTPYANEIKNVKKSVDFIGELDGTHHGDDYENWTSRKTISGTTGKLSDSDYYSACSDFIYIPPFAKLTAVTGSVGAIVAIYASDDDTAFIERNVYTANTTHVVDMTGARYIRIAIGSTTVSDNSTLELKIEYELKSKIDELSGSVEGFETDIDDITDDIEGIEENLSKRIGLDYEMATVLPNNSDFNNLTTPAEYRVGSNANMQTMAHRPCGYSGKIIIGTLSNANSVIQIVIPNSASNSIYYRKAYKSNDTWTWQNWDEVTNKYTILTNTAVIDSSNYSSYFSDYNDVPANTVYRINAAPMAHAPVGTGIVDRTGEHSGYPTGVLMTFESGGVKSQIFLTYHVSTLQTYINFRTSYLSSGTLVWMDWQKLSEQNAITATNIAIRKEMVDGGDAPFTDLDDVPANTIYQLDLDLAEGVMGHNPVAGHSGVLLTFGFAHTSRHGMVQMCYGIDNGIHLYMRYGFQNAPDDYRWTGWRKVTTDIPEAPSTNGTYVLQCTVSSGVKTYSWVSTT